MSTMPHTTDDRSPIGTALSNTVYAIFLCTAIHVLLGWGIDWVNDMIGNPPAHKAPTWTGTAIVAAQTGWPVLALAALCGLFGRSLAGLVPTLVAMHFLGLLDRIAALVVGVVLVLIQTPDEE